GNPAISDRADARSGARRECLRLHHPQARRAGADARPSRAVPAVEGHREEQAARAPGGDPRDAAHADAQDHQGSAAPTGAIMRAQQEKAIALRALHERPGVFIIPNAWDAGSAKLLASLGFEALAT